MRKYRVGMVLSTLLLMIHILYGQGSAGSRATFEPRYIIDMPTAGVLARGSYSIDMDFFQAGGLMMRINAGIVHNVSFGISYGANHIVGSDKIEPNPFPGVNIRIRIINETPFMPAILLGFDSQGKEPYIKGVDRYTIKSPGFFAVASKNYSMLGYLSVHGGMNYSLENNDGAEGLNFYIGAEKSLGPDMSILLEYNFAFNDNRKEALGRGRGYLNAGYRWSVGRGFTLGFDLKDLFKNQKERISAGNRTVFLEYVGFF